MPSIAPSYTSCFLFHTISVPLRDRLLNDRQFCLVWRVFPFSPACHFLRVLCCGQFFDRFLKFASAMQLTETRSKGDESCHASLVVRWHLSFRDVFL